MSIPASRPGNNRQALPGAVRVTVPDLIALRRAGEQLVLPRARIRAHMAGGFLSAVRGRGMEFDEARPYQPGDDVRAIDWRVTARTGKPHTKLYREERERPVLLWVDDREGMHFATRGCLKSVFAARTAALLAWSSVAHGDRIGGLVFSDTGHHELRPRRGKPGALHLMRLLAGDGAADGPASGDLAAPAARLRRVARPGSLVYLLSDFRGLSVEAETHLMELARHNSVVLLFISDPLEAELPPPGRYHVSDGTRRLAVDTGDDAFRRSYAQAFATHQHRLQMLARRSGMAFLPCHTNDDPLECLRAGLRFGSR